MSRSTVPVADLTDLAAAALRRGGVPAPDADRVARILVLSDLFGIGTHGVSRVAEYLDRVRLGGIDPAAPVRVDRVGPALTRVNGANGLGPLIGTVALEAAMDGARATGLGAAFARGSNHFGPAMPYLFLAAEEGFAAIVASNATTTIAPWGGREPRLGNNPLGIGVPHPGGDPVLLDMAMSVVARARVRAAAKAGTPIPETWATDADGVPTTDPDVALTGNLLPFGGHKGYGLALMVDLFAGLLSGAAYLDHVSSWSESPEAPQNLGQLFLLVDTARLLDGAALAERMADFAGILHATPPADPDVPVRLPGEAELAERRRQTRDGVDVDAEVFAELRRLAGQL